MKAIQFGVITYDKNKIIKHIRIMSDNFTTMSYINKKGGLQSHECNKIAKDIWICCTSRDLHISLAHISGKNNSEADKISRKFQETSEWQLNPKIHKAVCDIFGTPEIGLFASQINKQTQKYVSWRSEPEAFAGDAFSINFTKDQAKSNKFDIATGQSSCSSFSRKIGTAHKIIHPHGRLNVDDTTNSIHVVLLRESRRKNYNS